MKNLGFILIIVSVVWVSAGQAASVVGGRYQSEQTYSGVYEKNRIYSKRSVPGLWRGTAKPAKIFSVKCREAADSLSRLGTWTGNLKGDGSCGGQNEPAEYATGNYLNYVSVPDSGQ